jgi:hypothetical protein
MYSLYNTSVELDTRLATVPQPAFHYNILLASLAIDHFFSEDSNSIFQQLPRIPTTTTPRYMTSGRTVEKTVLLALVV